MTAQEASEWSPRFFNEVFFPRWGTLSSELCSKHEPLQLVNLDSPGNSNFVERYHPSVVDVGGDDLFGMRRNNCDLIPDSDCSHIVLVHEVYLLVDWPRTLFRFIVTNEAAVIEDDTVIRVVEQTELVDVAYEQRLLEQAQRPLSLPDTAFAPEDLSLRPIDRVLRCPREFVLCKQSNVFGCAEHCDATSDSSVMQHHCREV